MNFTEEQATQLMQYAIDERERHYQNLKSNIIHDKKVYNADFRHIHESMADYLQGIVVGVYSMLLKSHVISIEDFRDMCDEVHRKFDVETIYAEIKNQESLNV